MSLIRRRLKDEAERSLVVLSRTVLFIVVVASLYWAQSVFVPVALAMFVSFLLTPGVKFLERRGLGRIPSLILVLLLAAGISLSFGFLVWNQFAALAEDLPAYSSNIKAKIHSIQEMSKGSVADRLRGLVDELSTELGGGKDDKSGPGQTGPDRPTAVTLEPKAPLWMSNIVGYFSPAVDILGGTALSLVLVGFMLFKREDLRSRLIRLFGDGDLTLTTKAVEEADHRISRFLVMQAIVNGSYGATLGIGLYFIGVNHALLWGFIAAILRYIPYIGAWIAAVPPIALSMALSVGWSQPITVVIFFIILELISNNLMEPWLYGRSMGVSEVGLLVSTAFWAFLWGPIGMVLSSSLTVVLVVLGKYVKQMEFFTVLLGDEPPLEPSASLYQRLLAADSREAFEIAQKQVKLNSMADIRLTLDSLVVPALTALQRDRLNGNLSEADETKLLGTTTEVVEKIIAEHKDNSKDDIVAQEPPLPHEKPTALFCPAKDLIDLMGIEMLKLQMNPADWNIEVAGVEALTSELMDTIVAKNVSVVCIGSIPPGSYSRAKYLCIRLNARFPNLKIIVARWGQTRNVERLRERLELAGADAVCTAIEETRQKLATLLPVLRDQSPGNTEQDTKDTPKKGTRKFAATAK